ncbi:Na/Pi cotransporter family protein [Sulfurivermis fontis]|uniref:Na/Pi cotransporter family protein n=1 Tax=Sulfurivermis fontis TaxID=1972068 RepID=UPI000FDB01FA|nr:Na/Pi cotransporter family protein [Sulfurivermis fontis]
MDFGLFGSFIGGIGLFLLGMRMMTDGLKLAAGPALRHILGQWTRTPLRGIFAGVLITSMVQSSSAVTVATIGFVNAGLLSLVQSVGVIYGANVGTTTTSWLVAIVGFKINVQALALPFIGIGAALRLTGTHSRRAAVGDALVGFGLFFLGVDVLKSAFEGLGQRVPLAELGGGGIDTVLIFVGIGFLLTLLMQSSSASIALILTATMGGMVPLTAAAAAVIGANVGTTSTAALAVIGATSSAKRVAAAHVLFNILVAIAALLILPLMLTAVDATAHILALEDSPAITLALFHTASKLLGVALLWPLTPRLVTFLSRRFRTAEEELGKPRYLDKNVLATPTLAIDAVALELARIGGMARDMAQMTLTAERTAPANLMTSDKLAIASLVEAVGQFAVQMQRTTLPAEFDESLPDALRVARYYTSVADLADNAAQMQERMSVLQDEPLISEITFFRADALKLLQAADPQAAGYDSAAADRMLAAMEDAYQSLKAHLLRAGSEGRLRTEQMVELLDFYSRIRRLLQQAVKGARYLHRLLDLAAATRQKKEEPTPAEEPAAEQPASEDKAA